MMDDLSEYEQALYQALLAFWADLAQLQKDTEGWPIDHNEAMEYWAEIQARGAIMQARATLLGAFVVNSDPRAPEVALLAVMAQAARPEPQPEKTAAEKAAEDLAKATGLAQHYLQRLQQQGPGGDNDTA